MHAEHSSGVNGPTEHGHGSAGCAPGPGGLDAQIERLIALGIPHIVGRSAVAFRRALEPLKQQLHGIVREADPQGGTAGAVIVLNTPKLGIRELLPRVSLHGKTALEKLYPKQPEDFRATVDIHLPAGEAYLLLGVDRGDAMRNAVPLEASQRIAAEGRSPLTIEEGLMLVLQWPTFLRQNHCFMLLGSRCGDRRVPALWLSQRHPRLGWCWEGNPHTWLGFASCGRRSAGVALAPS